jgi:folate-dependent phosphoribosylglycinamide formyltransferase PurN
MDVACFVSGSGTNARRIIENSGKLTGYRVSLIFTDVKDSRRDKKGNKICKAKDIAESYGISYEVLDILDFYNARNHQDKRDLSLRPYFDKKVVEILESYDLDLIALAGYMSIVTDPLLNRYKDKIINVHPADLAIQKNGKRKYKGLHAVRDAILSGEKKLRSTTHIVRKDVDEGEIVMRSKGIPIILPDSLEELNKNIELEKIIEENQNRLKKYGDWLIYPLTLELIAKGRFSINKKGILMFEGVPKPKGLTL